MKKAISVLLTLVLVLGVCGAAVTAGARATYTPILRIHGENVISYTAEDGKEYALYDDGEYISAIVDAALPYAFPALITGDWSKWSEAALEQILPAYEHFKTDTEGNVPPESHTQGRYSVASIGYNDSYSVAGSYELWPELRRSPMDEADYLNEVIETIKEKTGHDKIILIGQCLGNNYLMAYLQKYEEPRNFSGVESVVLSTTTSNGLIGDDYFFSGNLKIEMETAYKGLKTYEFPAALSDIAGGELMNAIYDTLDLVYQSYFGQKVTLAVVQNVYNHIKDSFIARLLQEYYGRNGGMVTAVTDHYEEYKDYVFPTAADKEKYAAQIAKFDDYRYNVQLRQPEIIREMQAQGITVSCLTEYGIQCNYFLGGEEALVTSDNRVPANRGSYGATCANIGETLSDDYIASREAAGYGRYISPDRQIDASTGLLPDNTWYLKNCAHHFDGPIMELVTAVVRTPDSDIDKIAAQGYPQFMWYEDSNTPLRPLTAEDTDAAQVVKPQTTNFIAAFFRWIKTVFNLLKSLFSN